MAVAIFVVSAYPLQCHPARASIGRIIYAFFPKLAEPQFSPIIPQNNQPSALDFHSSQPSSSMSPNPTQVSYSTILKTDDNPRFSTDSNLSHSQTIQNSLEQQTLSHVNKELNTSLFFIITTCLLVSSYLLAVSVKSLGLILMVVGSTGSTSISFILPGLMFYKISQGSKLTILKIMAVLLAIYGLFVMFVSLIVKAL
ncbi:Vacuolar amino acid transporter 6 [Smittium culicis]|uniref:Vacuolar amino acid transporter 6 n=1 Tax=Smittium culicis TaxID=133412 RepID=A0A1R1Y1X7_9FUNG|nr:Vacuolar amino acid transporter 6 [Smittium culicis]